MFATAIRTSSLLPRLLGLTLLVLLGLLVTLGAQAQGGTGSAAAPRLATATVY